MAVGQPETKKLSDVMSEADLMAAMKSVAEQAAAAGGADDDESVPDLVSGVNFEAVAKPN